LGGIAKIVTCASSADHPTQRVELLTADDGNGVATPHVYVTDANSDEYVADFTFGGGGGGGGWVYGVKGAAESSYRAGYVSLSAGDVGAATSSHVHSASDLVAWIGMTPVQRATSDAIGNDIAETYAKIDDIHDYAEVVIASVAEVRLQLIESGWTAANQGA
jgi:hypothetical protein